MVIEKVEHFFLWSSCSCIKHENWILFKKILFTTGFKTGFEKSALLGLFSKGYAFTDSAQSDQMRFALDIHGCILKFKVPVLRICPIIAEISIPVYYWQHELLSHVFLNFWWIRFELESDGWSCLQLVIFIFIIPHYVFILPRKHCLPFTYSITSWKQITCLTFLSWWIKLWIKFDLIIGHNYRPRSCTW